MMILTFLYKYESVMQCYLLIVLKLPLFLHYLLKLNNKNIYSNKILQIQNNNIN